MSTCTRKGVKDCPKCNYCNKFEIEHGVIGKKKTRKTTTGYIIIFTFTLSLSPNRQHGDASDSILFQFKNNETIKFEFIAVKRFSDASAFENNRFSSFRNNYLSP